MILRLLKAKHYLTLLLIIISSPLRADTVSSPAVHSQLESIAQQWAIHKLKTRYPHATLINVEIRSPKSAENLPQCLQPPRVTSSTLDVGRTRVSIECENPGWSTRLTANSYLEIPVLVATHPMRKGARLSEDDYRLQSVTLRTPSQPFYYQDSINGQQLKRNVKAGDIFTPKLISLSYAVRKGDLVTIFFNSDTFSLTAEGIAEEDGVIGDTIKVRNSQSGKLLISTVIDNRQVEVR